MLLNLHFFAHSLYLLHLVTANCLSTSTLTHPFYAENDFHRPCLWKILSLIPLLAAAMQPPALKECVPYSVGFKPKSAHFFRKNVQHFGAFEYRVLIRKSKFSFIINFSCENKLFWTFCYFSHLQIIQKHFYRTKFFSDTYDACQQQWWIPLRYVWWPSATIVSSPLIFQCTGTL